MSLQSISRVHPANTTALGGNLPFGGMEWRSSHKPEYHVYLFNVSARTFEKFGKFNMSLPGVNEDDPTEVMDGKNRLPGKENERYHYCTSFPQPILISKEKLDENEIGWVEQDAIRYVVDMISPDNLTRSLDFVVKPENSFSVGTNLAEKGVFFSLTNPPQQIDLRKAIDRMEKYYTALIDRANVLDLTDKAELQRQLTSNPDIAFAASYFGREFSWNKKQVKQVTCENCGEGKPSGRKFHQTSYGALCVEPTVEGWKAAVNSGMKRYDDVPDEIKWKKAEPNALELGAAVRQAGLAGK